MVEEMSLPLFLANFNGKTKAMNMKCQGTSATKPLITCPSIEGLTVISAVIFTSNPTVAGDIGWLYFEQVASD